MDINRLFISGSKTLNIVINRLLLSGVSTVSAITSPPPKRRFCFLIHVYIPCIFIHRSRAQATRAGGPCARAMDSAGAPARRLQLTPHASLCRAHLRNAWLIKDSGHYWCPVCGSCIDAEKELGASTCSPSEAKAGGERRALLSNTSLQRGYRSKAEAQFVTMGMFVVTEHGRSYCPLCSRDISEQMPTNRAETQPPLSSAAPMQRESQREVLREVMEASDRTLKRARTVYAAASAAVHIHDTDSQETEPRDPSVYPSTLEDTFIN